MGQVERLVDDFLAREDRSRTWFSKQMGMNDKTLSSWFARGRKSPIPPGAIKAIARVLHVEYRTVLDAVLYDTGYLPESSVVDIRNKADAVAYPVSQQTAQADPAQVVKVKSSDVVPVEPTSRASKRRSPRPSARQ